VSQVLSELVLQLTDQVSGLPQVSESLAASGAKAPAVATATGDGGGGVDGAVGATAVEDPNADIQSRLEHLLMALEQQGS
jgi:charged multivesicular body protein 2A